VLLCPPLCEQLDRWRTNNPQGYHAWQGAPKALTRTHTHRLMRTRALTHMHKHAHTHKHAHMHTRTQARARMLTHTHTHTHARTLIRTPPCGTQGEGGSLEAAVAAGVTPDGKPMAKSVDPQMLEKVGGAQRGWGLALVGAQAFFLCCLCCLCFRVCGCGCVCKWCLRVGA